MKIRASGKVIRGYFACKSRGTSRTCWGGSRTTLPSRPSTIGGRFDRKLAGVGSGGRPGSLTGFGRYEVLVCFRLVFASD